VDKPVSGGVGVIIPPPDIRGVIDKTAQFVAKMGPEFETRVLQEQNTTKFAFLLPQNPFRAYYEFKVKEFTAGNEPAPKEKEKPSELVEAERELARKKEKKQDKVKMLMHEAEADKDIPPPAADQFTINRSLPLTPLDADVISVVAQFVARNGQKFLVGLTQRESKNPQFDFLKPTHSLFSYFTTLVDAYTKVLIPAKEDVVELKKYTNEDKGFHYIFEKAMRRYHYDTQQAKVKKVEDAKLEAEKEQMALIDWHDFIVVETIVFTKEDDEIPLASPMEPTKAILEPVSEPLDISTIMPDTLEEEEPMEMEMEVEAPEVVKEVSTTVEKDKETEEKEDFLEEEKPDENEIPIPTDVDLDAPMNIRTNYVRQSKKTTNPEQEFQKCPITGQLLPVDEVNEHMRISMLNPLWKKEQDVAASKRKQENLFSEDVEANLDAFAKKRPDIFGTVDEEIQVAAEAGAEQSAREAGADAGPAASVYNPEAVKPLPPAPPAPPIPNVMVNPMYSIMRRQQAGAALPLPPNPPATPPVQPRVAVDEQAAKRLKTTDDEPLTKAYLTVVVSAEFGVAEQKIPIQVTIAEKVSKLKDMLQAITQIPVAKMSLKHQRSGLILHPDNNLVPYDIAQNDIIEMTPKERGGKRK